MKTILIICIVFVVIIVFVQASVLQSTDNTEQQEYDIIETEGAFEIRYYPEATMASIMVDGDYSNSSGYGFRILAGYIFGANSEETKIAMTAPVHMMENTNGYYMSFVMPSGFDTTNLPVPDNGQIRIHNSSPAYTASVRFGGFANDEKIKEQKSLLREYLNIKGIKFHEPFVYLGYNPPYQMVNRRNEIMVKIDHGND